MEPLRMCLPYIHQDPISRMHLFLSMIPDIGFRTLVSGVREPPMQSLAARYAYAYNTATADDVDNVIQGLPGYMTASRVELAKQYLPVLIRSLYGMLCRAWDPDISAKEAEEVFHHCQLLEEDYEERVAEQLAREKDGDFQGDDDDDLSEDMDVEDDEDDLFYGGGSNKDMSLILGCGHKLAETYRKAIQNVVYVRKARWIKDYLRQNSDLRHLRDYISWFFDADSDNALKDAWTMLDAVETASYVLSYIAPHQMPCDILNVDYVTASERSDPRAIHVQQSAIVSASLKLTLRLKGLTIEVDLGSFYNHSYIEVRGQNDVRLKLQCPDDLCRKFFITIYDDTECEGKAVEASVFGKPLQCGHTRNVIGDNVDIRTYAVHNGVMVPLMVFSILNKKEVKVGYLFYQGGRSVMWPELCDSPSPELAALTASHLAYTEDNRGRGD